MREKLALVIDMAENESDLVSADTALLGAFTTDNITGEELKELKILLREKRATLVPATTEASPLRPAVPPNMSPFGHCANCGAILTHTQKLMGATTCVECDKRFLGRRV